MTTEFESHLADVIHLAARVRESQDQYFRDRDRAKLIEARTLEKALDNQLGPTLAEARRRGWRPPS
jgi:hypothetical protein